MKYLGSKALYALSPRMVFHQPACEPLHFAAPRFVLYADTIRWEWRMFLGWYDPDKKKSLDKKLADAISRYEHKWEKPPTVALVNPTDFEALVERDGIEIRPAGHVAPNVFFVGCEFEDSVVS